MAQRDNRPKHLPAIVCFNNSRPDSMPEINGAHALASASALLWPCPNSNVSSRRCERLPPGKLVHFFVPVVDQLVRASCCGEALAVRCFSQFGIFLEAQNFVKVTKCLQLGTSSTWMACVRHELSDLGRGQRPPGGPINGCDSLANVCSM